MPGLDGTAAATLITQNFPTVRVLLLTMYTEDDALRSVSAPAATY